MLAVISFSEVARTIPIYPSFSQGLLVLTAGFLFYVAFGDLRKFRIPNEFIIVLTILYFAHASVSGRWVLLPWHVGFAAILFVVLLYAYSKNMLGGGDVKILTVAFLWTGSDAALVFALCLLGFSMIHIVAARLGWVTSPVRADGRPRIAYAPSVAGALVVIFALGYLAPLTQTALGPM